MASWYAFLTNSTPPNADAIINRVDLGVWKLVIMQLAILKSYGGKINLFVQPSISFNIPFEDTELSMARMAVVPTAQIRFLFLMPLFTISTALESIINSSLSILCLDKS